MVEGYYEGEFHALFRKGTARLILQDGRLWGVTSYGIPLEGTYEFFPGRNTHRFEVTAHMPAFFESITGLSIGQKGRVVKYGGEATPHKGRLRFSVDFVGRTIDILLERKGPAEMAKDLPAPPAAIAA